MNQVKEELKDDVKTEIKRFVYDHREICEGLPIEDIMSMCFLGGMKTATNKIEKMEKDFLKVFKQGGEKPKKSLKDINILIVDDNLINQRIILLSLQKIVGSIHVANDGRECIKKFQDFAAWGQFFDVILMDITMPHWNGYETTQRIRAIESHSGYKPTPIIGLSTNENNKVDGLESCLNAGMNDFICKPFQVDRLVEKIVNLTIKPETPQEEREEEIKMCPKWELEREMIIDRINYLKKENDFLQKRFDYNMTQIKGYQNFIMDSEEFPW